MNRDKVIEKVEKMLDDIKSLKNRIDTLKPDAEAIRSWYKHQSEDLDSSSEEFILCFTALDDTQHMIHMLEDILEKEGDADET